MKNMPMCPMMMQNMPMHQMPMMQMPMMQNMPMMQQPMNMFNMNCDNNYNDADERDEEYFATMQSENGNRMMPYVMKTVDRMEKKGDMIYAEYPDKQMVAGMSEEAYNNMVRDMPDMADEYEEERQFGGRRRFGRDLITILLLNELLGRRRRRRRRHGYGYGDYDYNNYNDFYYNE
jgi:hypothetical protein